MTTTSGTTDIILDALLAAEGGLTLVELATATGLPCNVLRASLESIDHKVESALERPVVEGAGDESKLGKAVRVFRANEQARVLRENALAAFAATATEDALRGEARNTLRVLAHALGAGADIKAKATKDTLVATILAHQATHRAALDAALPTCSRCGEEPVSRAGEVCTVCEETANPAPVEKAPRVRRPKAERPEGDLRIRIRRPDVALALTDSERAAVEAIVKGAPSQRAAQRDVAHWLADRNPERFADAEVLRTILRTHGALNAANFTINAKKEGWPKVEAEGALKGWTIAKLAIKVSKAAERGA